MFNNKNKGLGHSGDSRLYIIEQSDIYDSGCKSAISFKGIQTGQGTFEVLKTLSVQRKCK